jgi:hypothetical protein
MAMERSGAQTVTDLDDELLVTLAPRLWITPPRGGLL